MSAYETAPLFDLIQHFWPSSVGSFCGGDRRWLSGVSKEAVISNCKDGLRNPCSISRKESKPG